MQAFLELINGILNGIIQTYLQEAPQGTSYPYATYEINPSDREFQRDLIILEINVWDNTTDTTNLETTVENIEKALDRFKYYEKDVLQTSIYLMNRSMVADPDPLIKRRQLLFQCKTYIKRSE